LFSNQKNNNLENMKIWLLTDKLSLTEKQAKNFFPRFKQNQEKIKKNNLEIKNLHNEFNLGQSLSKNEFEKIKFKLFKLQKNNLELKQNFISDVEDILDFNQRVELMNFEEWFKNELKRTARKMHEKENLNNHSKHKKLNKN